MKRVLITGGSGFIGRNLTEYLNKQYSVFAPRHSELELLDRKSLCKYVMDNKIDYIIHAAIHVPSVNGINNEFDNDMLMFHNVVSMADRVDKIIYFGSGAEYDKKRNISLASEDEIGVFIPDTDYGRAKFEMNQIARDSSNIYNLRLFGVFGQYELWQIKFISNICCKALFDLPLSIRKDCYFDYLYIDDLCRITDWFLNNTTEYHDYNVCMGKEYLLSSLAELVLGVSKKELPVNIIDQSGYAMSYSGSSDRLANEITWIKDLQIEDGIKKLYDYYYKHIDLIDYEVLKGSR